MVEISNLARSTTFNGCIEIPSVVTSNLLFSEIVLPINENSLLENKNVIPKIGIKSLVNRKMTEGTTSEGNKTQDVLHFTPELVKILDSPQAIRLLEDPDYYIIVEILRKRPMTIREIEDAYKLRASDHETVEPKSYNTIYRYIKALEKEGLVIPGGKRVEFGKTAAETLFSRTAKLFHFGCPPDMTEEGREFVDRVLGGLMLLYGGSKVTESCLRETINEISVTMKDEITKLAQVDHKVKLDEILAGEWGIMIKTLDYIAFLSIILNHPELVKKLKDCF